MVLIEGLYEKTNHIGKKIQKINIKIKIALAPMDELPT